MSGIKIVRSFAIKHESRQVMSVYDGLFHLNFIYVAH